MSLRSLQWRNAIHNIYLSEARKGTAESKVKNWPKLKKILSEGIRFSIIASEWLLHDAHEYRRRDHRDLVVRASFGKQKAKIE